MSSKRKLWIEPKYRDDIGKLNLQSDPVLLGRSEGLQISVKRCSREHVKIQIDEETDELVIQQLGSNKAAVFCNGAETTLAKHSSKRISLEPHSKKSQAKEEIDSTTVCSLWLLSSPKKEYQFDVVIQQRPESNQTSEKTEKKIMKRKMGITLDGFVTKKPKKDDGTSDSVKASWFSPVEGVHIYKMADGHKCDKIAAFDMDSTLIVTSSGAKWPKDKDDWKFMFANVLSKLRNLHDDGFKVAIFTNQGGIQRGNVKLADIQHKMEAIVSKLSIPVICIICASNKGPYRKPMTGMWDYIVDEMSDGTKVNVSKSLYVGDAAGRPAGWAKGKRKDFASSDRLFALNIGVPFHTPESFFTGCTEPPYEMPEFNPQDALKEKTLLEPATADLNKPNQEMVLMVGFPGSGKSHFCTKHLSGYEHISRDQLGSWQKCVAKCEAVLKEGKSVVIDNTNPDVESRSRYTALAKSYKIPVRCFLMNTSYKQARHNEKYRQLTNSKHTPINDMVVNMYKSKYLEPSCEEGFTQIVRVNSVLDFPDESSKRLYLRYLLEK